MYICCMKKQTDIVEIKYRKKVLKDADGDKTYEYDFISADVKFTRRYNSVVCLIMGITGCGMHLMEWLSGNMTENGFINNNAITRKTFADFHSKHKGKANKSYGDDAINKAFRQLSDVGFLVSMIKGVYKINPLYYFVEDDSKRISSIKYIMEFKHGVETTLTREVK